MQNQGPVQTSRVSENPFPKHYEPTSQAKTIPLHITPTSKQVEGDEASTSIQDRIAVLKEPANLDRDDQNLDFLPSRFNHEINKTYVLGIKTKQTRYFQLIEKDPNNCNLRLQYAENSLLNAEIFDALLQQEEEAEDATEEAMLSLTEKLNEAFNIAKDENQLAKKLNALHPRHYYIESMIIEFEGVNCTNFEQVEKYVMLLKISLALDPTSTEVAQTLQESVTFLKTRWAELLQEDAIDDATYLAWTQKLNEWLSNDTLKVFFANNPHLFKLATQAQHTAFFTAHPELKSVDAFLKKYPNLASIYLPRELDKDSVRKVLAEAETDPFATKLPIIRQTAILTPVVADEIKTAMLNYSGKQKTLRVYVGNEDDVKTIANSFRHDSSFSGALSLEILKMKDYSFPIHAVFINPSKPLTRI